MFQKVTSENLRENVKTTANTHVINTINDQEVVHDNKSLREKLEKIATEDVTDRLNAVVYDPNGIDVTVILYKSVIYDLNQILDKIKELIELEKNNMPDEDEDYKIKMVNTIYVPGKNGELIKGDNFSKIILAK